jgi:hypothetical protein
MKKLLSSLLLLASAGALYGQAWLGTLSTSRATDWTQAGIPGYSTGGSIPSDTWSKCGATISAGASAATVQAALNTCSGTSEYVLMGPGVYNWGSGTGILIKGKSNVELRGSGAGSTVINGSGGGISCEGGGTTGIICFDNQNGEYPAGVSSAIQVTSAPSQGATTLVLANSLSIQIGTELGVDQCDKGYSGYTTGNNHNTCGTGTSSVDNGQLFVASDAYCKYPNGSPVCPSGTSYNDATTDFQRWHRSELEFFVVTACSPSCNNGGTTTVTLNVPVKWPNWSTASSMEAWLIQPSSYVGLRDLTLNLSGANTMYSGVEFNNDVYYWMRNVAILNAWSIAFNSVTSSFGDVTSNYIYNAGQGSTTNDPSAYDFAGSNNVIANNIAHQVRVGIIFGGPSAGNFIGYNYLINADLYSGQQFMFANMWDGHTAGSALNLFEGNSFDQYFEDLTHGNKDLQTLYRNFVTGWESCANTGCGGPKNGSLGAIADLSYNRYGNYVNNVLGTPGGPSSAGYVISSPTGGNGLSGTTGPIFLSGSGNGCYSPGCIALQPLPVDSLVAATELRWGNWDAFNGTTRCQTAEVPSGITYYPNSVPSVCPSSGSMPASWYYTSRPTWYSSSFPFPLIGSDVSGGNVGPCTGTPNTSGQYALVPAFSNPQCTGTSLGTGWGGHVNASPAMTAFLSQGGVPDGSNAAISFNPSVYYAASVATPVPSPVPGSYSSTQTVSFTFPTSGSSGFCTTDGSTPTPSSTPYSGAFTVSSTTTVQCMATKSGLANSGVGGGLYSIAAGAATTPTFSASGTLPYGTPITISTTPSSCIPYIWWSSVNPPVAGSSNNSDSFSVLANVTIYAKVINCPTAGDSAVGSAGYSVGYPTPSNLSVVIP